MNNENNQQNKNNMKQNPYIKNNQQSSQNMQKQMNTRANPYMNNNQQTNEMMQTNQSNSKLLGSYSSTEILTGALVGAAATYILTNDNVQKTLFKGILSINEILSGGIDEMKERFEDAKAEHEAEKEL